MQIKQFRYSRDNLGYVILSARTALVIDGGAVNEIRSYLTSHAIDKIWITNTHSHFDHMTGNSELCALPNTEYLDHHTLNHGQSIELGETAVKVYKTPGHTSDGVTFSCPPYLITGDTLFNGKAGKCFSNDYESFLASIVFILTFPDSTMIYGGHDYVEEYMDFAKRLEPDNPHISDYLKAYQPSHVGYPLAEEKKVNPHLRFNDDQLIHILKQRGMPHATPVDRFHSLMTIEI